MLKSGTALRKTHSNAAEPEAKSVSGDFASFITAYVSACLLVDEVFRRIRARQQLECRKMQLWPSFEIMPEARVELARGCPRRILSPLRLPFRHSGQT
jgi:hypothetical protein